MGEFFCPHIFLYVLCIDFIILFNAFNYCLLFIHTGQQLYLVNVWPVLLLNITPPKLLGAFVSLLNKGFFFTISKRMAIEIVICRFLPFK